MLASAALCLPEADTAELRQLLPDGPETERVAPLLRALLSLIKAADVPEGRRTWKTRPAAQASALARPR